MLRCLSDVLEGSSFIAVWSVSYFVMLLKNFVGVIYQSLRKVCATSVVHGPIVILVPTRGTKDDCCKLIAHKVEIENLYDNLSVGVAFRVFFSCKSAGNDL